MILYGVKSFTEPNVLDSVNKKLTENQRVAKLQDYYNGKMEIDHRFYADPTKPNNKIKANYCKDIADFLTAYLVGVPVQISGLPQEILDILKYNDEDSELQQVVTDMNVSGFGVELFYFDESGDIRFNNINPIECIVFMDDDLQENIVAFLRIVKNDENIGGYSCMLYTATEQTPIEIDEGVGSVKFGEAEKHGFSDVPIVLYKNNAEMQGSFEQIIPMQDALNKIYSDNVNDFESFVDAYLCLEGMQGTQAEDLQEMKTNRVLLLPDNAKAYWLVKEVNHEHIKTLQDDLRATILELGNVPDMKDITGMNVSGEAMKMRLTKTEIQASRQERIVTKGIRRKLEFLYYATNLISSNGTEYTDPDIVFTRNFLISDDTETETEDEAQVDTENSQEDVKETDERSGENDK